MSNFQWRLLSTLTLLMSFYGSRTCASIINHSLFHHKSFSFEIAESCGGTHFPKEFIAFSLVKFFLICFLFPAKCCFAVMHSLDACLKSHVFSFGFFLEFHHTSLHWSFKVCGISFDMTDMSFFSSALLQTCSLWNMRSVWVSM